MIKKTKNLVSSFLTNKKVPGFQNLAKKTLRFKPYRGSSQKKRSKSGKFIWLLL